MANSIIIRGKTEYFPEHYLINCKSEFCPRIGCNNKMVRQFENPEIDAMCCSGCRQIPLNCSCFTNVTRSQSDD